jgi:hypothetical protein
MIAFGTASHGQAKRRHLRAMGITYHKSEWMETGDDPRLSPTVSLIEQHAGTVLPAHFHVQNQFQVFVDGGGTIGPLTLAPVTIHYADAYTAYGPLSAGAEGITYFTIRPVCETGAHPVATSRDAMVRGPKRHSTITVPQLHSIEQLAALNEPVSSVAIPHASDGLGASLHALPPGGRMQCTAPEAADGIFVVVLTGKLQHAGGEVARWESVFASRPGEFPDLTAGPEGAEFVFLFVPAKAQAYL